VPAAVLIYSLSLHDALPICPHGRGGRPRPSRGDSHDRGVREGRGLRSARVRTPPTREPIPVASRRPHGRVVGELSPITPTMKVGRRHMRKRAARLAMLTSALALVIAGCSSVSSDQPSNDQPGNDQPSADEEVESDTAAPEPDPKADEAEEKMEEAAGPDADEVPF